MFGGGKTFRGRRAEKRRRVRLIVSLLVVLGLLGLFLACVWYGTRHQSVTISEVYVSGGETISHEEVRDAVWRELRGTYFFFVPKTFSYLYPAEAVASAGVSPRIKALHVEREGRKKLTVEVEEYIPRALWCTREDMQHCLFLDEYGYAFALAPGLDGSLFLRYIRENVELEEKSHIFNEVDFRASLFFAHALRERHDMRVGHVVVTRDGDVTYHLTRGGSIITDPRLPVEKDFENLASVLGSEDFSHLKPGMFDYIDLRFEGKVFVKEEIEENEKVEEPTLDESALRDGMGD